MLSLDVAVAGDYLGCSIGFKFACFYLSYCSICILSLAAPGVSAGSVFDGGSIGLWGLLSSLIDFSTSSLDSLALSKVVYNWAF